MKIEQLFVQYLYINKKVTLQNIGSFLLSPDIAIPEENEKDAALPDNAISFEYNSKAPQDESLIDFIVQQTRKIKPLATSDLESFTMLGRQFMNIGKPLLIEGLGILQKNQQGQYEFIQGHTISHRVDQTPASYKEKENEEIVFTTPPRKQANNKWILPLLLIIIVLGSLAFFYFRYNENKNSREEKLVATQADTSAVTKDSLNDTQKILAAEPAQPVIAKKDSYNFKIVIKEYENKFAADKAYARLRSYGHKLLLYPLDSVRYKIAIPFMTPLSDTSRARDSLKIFFGGRPYVEIN